MVLNPSEVSSAGTVGGRDMQCLKQKELLCVIPSLFHNGCEKDKLAWFALHVRNHKQRDGYSLLPPVYKIKMCIQIQGENLGGFHKSRILHFALK